jgi:hypothetical protein
VLNPAAIVIDPEKIRRFDRARCTYHTMFYRANNTLDAHRKGDPPAAGKADRRGGAGVDENAAGRRPGGPISNHVHLMVESRSGLPARLRP